MQLSTGSAALTVIVPARPWRLEQKLDLSPDHESALKWIGLRCACREA